MRAIRRFWLSLVAILFCQNTVAEDLIISGVFHGPLDNAPTGVELYVINDIPDLSIYGLGTADNGNGTNGQEFTFPSKSATQGSYIYVVSKVDNFFVFFGFSPHYMDSDMKVNGNDGFEMFKNGVVIDRYGEPDISGRNTVWEYMYGWAYRNDDVCPVAEFNTDEWRISGRYVLKDAPTNDEALLPIPIKTYTNNQPRVCTPIPPEPAEDALISEIQGTPETQQTSDSGETDVSPLLGKRVAVEGIVVGDFQDGDADSSRNLGGFYLQEETTDEDGDVQSSEGIFVAYSEVDVALGDKVAVEGTVVEVDSETRIAEVTELAITTANQGVIPVDEITIGELDLALIDEIRDGHQFDDEPDLEAWEGMLVQIQSELTLIDQSNLKQFNEVTLYSGDRPEAYTQGNSPAKTGFAEAQKSRAGKSILYDDGLNERFAGIENLVGFEGYDTDSAPRLGDQVEPLAVLDYKGSGNDASGPAWRLRAPKSGNEFTSTEMGSSPNPRPSSGPSAVGGDISLATVNLGNWFKTLNDGAQTTELGLEPAGALSLDEATYGLDADAEFDRQLAKLVVAMVELDADLFALTEVENEFDATANGSTAVEVLVDALNSKLGEQRYDYLYPGRKFLGDAVNAVALVYDTSTLVVADGSEPAILNDTVLAKLPEFSSHDFVSDPVFDGADNNRAVLAATFAYRLNNDQFTVAVAQLMGREDSAIEAASGGNLDQSDGAGFWNDRRTLAAQGIAAWLATSPTGVEEADVAIMGSLNAYAKERPVTYLLGQGYVRAISEYNSVENAEQGTLDYLFLNEAFAQKRLAADVWHINADESPALGYRVDYAGGDGYLDATSPARYASRDPILAGMAMALPPEANAGEDFEVNEGALANLDGSNSIAGDYPIAEWQWVLLANDNAELPSIELLNTDTATPSFIAPEVLTDTAFEFELTVLDERGLSSVDSVIVTVRNLFNAPQANAGTDQTVNEGDTVVLDGSASLDPEGELVSFEWQQLTGQTVELSSTTAEKISFEAPQLSLDEETLSFQLTVTDAEGASHTDQVQVTFVNVPIAPVADAGSDQTVDEGTVVTLSAIGSSDADDDIVRYEWSQVSGEEAELTQVALILSFEAPNVLMTENLVFEVKVTDRTGLTSSDQVTVTVRNLVHIPVANAGDDRTVDEGDHVSLSAAASTDEDDDIVVYRWTQLSGPSVALTGAKTALAEFNAPEQAIGEQAELVFQLTVMDAFGETSTTEVKVTVVDVPKAPQITLKQSLINIGPASTVTLDASATSDADDDISTYLWEQVSGPDATSTSGAATSKLTLITPTLTAGTVSEDMVFRVTVTDASGLSSQSDVTVSIESAIPSNQVVQSTVTEELDEPQKTNELGGCSLGGANAPADPTLPLMALMAAAWIARRWVGLSSADAS